jgi:hypothetical protein
MRKWQASGGYGTVFFALTFAAMGQQFSNTPLASLVPSKEFLTKPGFVAYMGRAGKFIILPAFVGKCVGNHIFGNPQENFNLVMNAPIY